MKLFVVLSVLAYGYADKLDRTYLPPVGAAISGGSPGELIAPIQSVSQTDGSTIIIQSGSGSTQGFSGSQQGSNGFISSNSIASNNNGFVGTSGGASSNIGGSVQTGFVSSQIGAQNGIGQAVGNFNQGFVLGSGQNVVDEYRPERPQAAAERSAEIVRYINENNVDFYRYLYGTSNGISAEEAGEALNGVRAQGAYSYTGDDGKLYAITYTADQNGFRAQGEHLPTPPPIPEDILKSLEINAKALAAGTQEGAYQPELYGDGVSQEQYSTGSTGLNLPTGGLGFVQDIQANQQASYSGAASGSLSGTGTQYQTGNQAVYQVTQGAQSIGNQQFGSAGSSGQGYQYQSNTNQNIFSSDGAINQGSGINQDNKITHSSSQTITGTTVQVISNGLNENQGSVQFSGPQQPPSFTAQEGYKY